jgi:nicotinic acid phosphoribosyltransferase
MRSLKVNDAAVILKLDEKRIPELKKDFISYLDNFIFEMDEDFIQKFHEEFLKHIEVTEEGHVYFSFSNGCVDNIIGTIFHAFCISRQIEILDFEH